jgi:hypothetical protein
MEREDQALWLEWSGLPAALNAVRANAWLVFRTIVEIDCGASRRPATIEIPLAELAERCGLDAAVVAKAVDALRKKKYLRCFLPEHPEESALLEIRVPIATPLSPEEVARRIPDPVHRDPAQYRYAHEPDAPPADAAKVQEVVDLYLNRISQKMNSFILEQIEIVAGRFEMEDIQRTIDRAARHEIRHFGWVLKELVREQGKKKQRE